MLDTHRCLFYFRFKLLLLVFINIMVLTFDLVSCENFCMTCWHPLLSYLFFYPASTLTGFHFAVTALVGLVSNATGYSASKHVPMWELLWFSVVANMSITGMNFSLMLNSVGFYQVWFYNVFSCPLGISHIMFMSWTFSFSLLLRILSCDSF